MKAAPGGCSHCIHFIGIQIADFILVNASAAGLSEYANQNVTFWSTHMTV